MKKIYTYLFLTTLSSVGFAQYEAHALDFNNVDAAISNSGMFFNDPIGAARYEVPKGSGNHMIYTMGFWFGGADINGNIKLAAQTYTENGDLFPGALTTEGAEAPIEAESAGVYPILKGEIDYHILHFSDVGYTVPSSIANWPAHGNIEVGIDYYLAPFVDVNGDGVYNPIAGDYPKIKGDKAIYLIMNDKGDLHETGSDPIGIEVHYLFYQYVTDDYLDNTTFVNMKIINRSTQSLYDFRVGCYLDGDVGYSLDDYAGFNEENNVMFVYNGDSEDEGTGAQPGYGTDPPALGVVLLNKEVNSFATYQGTGAHGEPTNTVHYYNYMNAIWPDGTHFLDNASEETNFLYSGNPNNITEWSEHSVANAPGERRLLMSASYATYTPSEVICLDYAIVYSRTGNNIENVQGVIDNAALVKSFYDSEEAYCEAGFLGLTKTETKNTEFSLYPNPSTGNFTVDVVGDYNLEIYSFDGRLVHQEFNKNGSEAIKTNLTNGTYLVVIKQGNKKSQSKLIIN